MGGRSVCVTHVLTAKWRVGKNYSENVSLQGNLYRDIHVQRTPEAESKHILGMLGCICIYIYIAYIYIYIYICVCVWVTERVEYPSPVFVCRMSQI